MKKMFERWLRPAAVLCILWAAACNAPLAEDSWTVMSWNVQNLFDDVEHGGEYPEFSPERGEWTSRLYRRRLENTADVILDAVPGGADLVVLQEIENAGVLEDLVRGPLSGAGYGFFFALPGYGLIRCGILSRYPLGRVEAADTGTGFGGRSLRPALAFNVDTPLGGVRVMAIHWKSPRDGREVTEPLRRREALVLETLLAEAVGMSPDARCIALGDWNTPGDGAVQPAALAPWDSGDRENSGAVIYRTPHAGESGIRDGEILFYDPEPEAFPVGTYWFNNRWDRPDRALLSPSLAGGGDWILSSCRTASSAVMGDAEGRPRRWVTRWEEGWSDHLPIVLEFVRNSGTNQ